MADDDRRPTPGMTIPWKLLLWCGLICGFFWWGVIYGVYLWVFAH